MGRLVLRHNRFIVNVAKGKIDGKRTEAEHHVNPSSKKSSDGWVLPRTGHRKREKVTESRDWLQQQGF